MQNQGQRREGIEMTTTTAIIIAVIIAAIYLPIIGSPIDSSAIPAQPTATPTVVLAPPIVQESFTERDTHESASDRQ